MEQIYSIEEILNAVNDLQKKTKKNDTNNLEIKRKKNNSLEIPQNTLRLIEEAEKINNKNIKKL